MKAINRRLKLQPRLKNAEHFALHNEIISNTKETILRIEGLEESLNRYQSRFDNENDKFRTFMRQPRTEVIQALNKARVDKLTYIRRLNSVGVISEDETIRTAAKQIDDYLHLYRDAGNVAYAETSALIFNLIEDLELRQNAPALMIMKLTDHVAELKERNEEFMREYSLRTDNRNPTELNQARKETDNAFYYFVDCINSLYVTQGFPNGDAKLKATVSEVIDQINGYIDHAETIYAKRVPSYRTVVPGENGSQEPETPEIEPYYMEVESQKDLVGWKFTFVDKDPEELTRFLSDVSLKDAHYYIHTADIGTNLYDYRIVDYIQEDELYTGIIMECFSSNYIGLSEKISDDAVLVKNGAIILRFGPSRIPYIPSIGVKTEAPAS